MTNSSKSKARPATLILLLNELYKQAKIWKIDAYNERSGRKFKLEIDFQSSSISVTKGVKELTNNDLAQMEWYAGLIPSKNEVSVSKKIEISLDNPGNRTVALAFDTNIILNRFYPNHIERYHSRPYERKPHLVVLSAGIEHEFHYMMSSTIRPDDAILHSLITNHAHDPIPYEILTDRYAPSTDGRNDPLMQVASNKGRLGIKGMREVRRIQEKYPVIISSPSHLYYSEKIQTQGKFIDAIFDSLIRYEAHFLQKNTNTDLLFLTSDKHQHQTAMTEGMKSLYVQPPAKPVPIQKDCFRLNFIERFIEELLVFSPYAKIQAGSANAYLSSAWRAMGPEESRNGVLRCHYNGKISKLMCG